MHDLEITREHKQALYEYMQTVKDWRELFILLTMITGARCTEILKLTAMSFKTDPLAVYIKALKGSNNRTVPIRPEHWVLLSPMMTALSAEPSKMLWQVMFPNISIISAQDGCRTMFRKLNAKLFTGKNYKLHSFRHSLAISAIESCHDIVKVQTILGHKSLGSTSRYLSAYAARQTLTEMLTLTDFSVKDSSAKTS